MSWSALGTDGQEAATDGCSIAIEVAEDQAAISNVREALVHLLGPDFHRRPPEPPSPSNTKNPKFQRLADHKWIFLQSRETSLLWLRRKMGRIDLLEQVRANIVMHDIFFGRKFTEKVRRLIAEFVAEAWLWD